MLQSLCPSILAPAGDIDNYLAGNDLSELRPFAFRNGFEHVQAMTTSQQQKAEKFASLHKGNGVFTIPNPWDIGSARMLESLGFEALATTSSGFAQTLGRSDGEVTLDEKMAHCRALADATDTPISADLENCFGDDPEAVALCIKRSAEAGLVGGSVEDFSGNVQQPIYELSLAVERVAAAVEAAAEIPFPFLVTARAEQLLRGDHDLDETIKRLQAYEAAGADVLYAPALKTLDEVRQVVDATNRPVNVLGTFLPGHSVQEIGAAGACRVSIGGGLARLIARKAMDTAKNLRDNGDLSWVASSASPE